MTFTQQASTCHHPAPSCPHSAPTCSFRSYLSVTHTEIPHPVPTCHTLFQLTNLLRLAQIRPDLSYPILALFCLPRSCSDMPHPVPARLTLFLTYPFPFRYTSACSDMPHLRTCATLFRDAPPYSDTPHFNSKYPRLSLHAPACPYMPQPVPTCPSQFRNAPARSKMIQPVPICPSLFRNTPACSFMPQPMLTCLILF